ncbi:carboxylesterase/lipase family protein [Sphingomonas daechungensis]|uniref:carboxylesterase/lipase family protein n=1 Tax=Sphingomonas daechungensis TaxID=1176646 RepID=UPI003783453B
MTKGLVFALLSLLVSLVPSLAEAAPVMIDSGKIEGLQSGAIRIFKGIPYAAPPVGPLRWRPPHAPSPWAGIRQATSFFPACPQLETYPPDAPKEQSSEDCLALNVWAPVPRSNAKLPVMVWIHGGGLTGGSGSVPQYAGEQLASHGVIVVTLNYRLGALGFLAHPELNKESAHGVSGNYGLLDQIRALQWVQRNIAAFGGDPDRVTIFGQSSGSFSVSMLASTPLAKGLFRRAIGQSGAVFEPVELDPRFTPDGSAEVGLTFAKRAGAKLLADLRRLPFAALLKLPFSPQFNVDGYVLPKSPRDAYASGSQNDADLLIGTNASEGSFFFDSRKVTTTNFDAVLERTYPSILLRAIGASPGKTDSDARLAAVAIDSDLRFRWDMWAWARHASKAGRRPVYFYSFTQPPAYRSGHPLFGLGPTHGAELPYVFGNLDPNVADWSSNDRALSETVQLYWTNFAKTGDPNGANLPRWPKFDRQDAWVMQLGPMLQASVVADQPRLRRIDQVYGAARFVYWHLYGVLAVAGLVLIAFVAGLYRFFRARRSRVANGRP